MDLLVWTQYIPGNSECAFDYGILVSRLAGAFALEPNRT